MKKLLMLVIGLLSAIYLVNPGAGVFAEIPDNLPLVGNLDEAAVTAILLSVLSYFGIDLKHLFGGKKESKPSGKDTIDVD